MCQSIVSSGTIICQYNNIIVSKLYNMAELMQKIMQL